MDIKRLTGRLFLVTMLLVNSLSLFSQSGWFIDGYHGGIWGHYPTGYTGFLIDKLQQHPQWNINLEIEPVTWDVVKQNDAVSYSALQTLLADTSINKRIEYVNPAYGQSYLYNISGESIIRQFSYGIKKLRQHFPYIQFETYSTEEPCFTSALPQILLSFGFKYASLKNPNTCWGGYTRAYGGELVKWIGPDGSWLYTVPRYSSEALEKNSTWQTTAWNANEEFVTAAMKNGVSHPVGMCLQDAGWKNGPWLGSDQKATYTTWQHYFKKVADPKLATSWRFSQEDVLVSLVWGSQALQRIAQQVRHAEDRIIAAEKLAAMAALQGKYKWPKPAFDEAWQSLLLAQHHDCWIVPYNGHKDDTWIDKVRKWTNTTEMICDSVSRAVLPRNATAVQIVNTTALNRTELVQVAASAGVKSIWDGKRHIPVQRVGDSILFNATVGSIGFNTFQLSEKPATYSGASIKQNNSLYTLETDVYRLVIDAAKGGTIRSLISKKINNKEWVNGQPAYAFNQLQGNFFEAGGKQRTGTNAATITVVENGPLRIKVKISNTLAGHPVHQYITLVQGQPRIDCVVHINWQHHTGIGNEYNQNQRWNDKEYKKAFYDDRNKLLLVFPVNINNQVIYKNAPFDVTTSRLQNTFFTTWDSIKNNIILHWADVADKNGQYGMALFTDHTTAYVHGSDHPLGLVVQYAGNGLWGRKYMLDGPTTIHYSLLPHAGTWDKAGVEEERVKLAEPLKATALADAGNKGSTSLIQLNKKGWEISSITVDEHDVLVRVYNAAASDSAVVLQLQAPAKKATIEALDGSVKAAANIRPSGNTVSVTVTAPRFGFRTIRFHSIIP